jgi:probable poly-beta-1,6-N-acetyl-D-glucosamine export protein
VPSRKELLPEIDLLRAVALVAVAFIHTSAWFVRAETPPTNGPLPAAAEFARFCVPAFIFCSGLLLYRAYGRPDEPARFLRRRWLRTLLPWVAWIPVLALNDFLNGGLQADARDLRVWLAFGPGHLYFLFLVAQLYLLLLVLPRSRRGLVAFTSVALALQLTLDVLHTYGPPGPGFWVWPVTYLPQMEAPFWAGYFCLGCLVGAEYERLRSRCHLWPIGLALAPLTALLVLAESRLVPDDSWRHGLYSFLWPSLLPLSLAVVTVLLWGGHLLAQRAGRLWAPVTALSRHSLGVYVLQVPVLYALGDATRQGWEPVPRFLLLIAGSVLISFALVALLTRHWLGALSVGEEKPPKGTRHVSLLRTEQAAS